MVAMGCETRRCRGRCPSGRVCYVVPRRPRRCHRRPGRGPVAHYVVGRYYDSQTGQFLSVDPLVEETGEPYAYVGDNPINGTDPSGRIFVGALGQGNGFNCPAELGLPVCYATATGWDPFDAITHWANTHTGTIVKAVAMGACIVSSVGVCAAWAIAATAAELYQEAKACKWTSANIEGTLLLGTVDVVSAGLVGQVEEIAANASPGFTETIVYRSISYSLRVLSVSPSLVVELSK